MHCQTFTAPKTCTRMPKCISVTARLGKSANPYSRPQFAQCFAPKKCTDGYGRLRTAREGAPASADRRGRRLGQELPHADGHVQSHRGGGSCALPTAWDDARQLPACQRTHDPSASLLRMVHSRLGFRQSHQWQTALHPVELGEIHHPTSNPR